MAGQLELVGIQAVVQGIAAFERDAANVNRLLTQINATTVGLGSRSTTAWGLVQSASTAALNGVVTGASLAVGALTALTSATVGTAARFENNLLKAGVAAGLTEGQMGSLGETIRKVGSDTSISIAQIESAANQLARSGITITDIQNGVLESTTKLAEASGGELGLAEASRLVSVAMNAWELSAKDVNSITGTLLGAANSSAIGFTDLSTSFQLSAPLAASMHISFQDLATAIAELGLAGVKGTVAGTALKTMLERLANPTKLASELMSQYGISIQDSAGNIVSLPEIIKRLEDALGDQTNSTHKLTDAQKEQIAGSLGGTRAVLDILALANKGTETFDKLSETIRRTDVEDFAARMRETLIPQLGVLRNQVESFIIQLGTPLEKALSDGVTNINKLIRSLDPRIPKLFGDALLAVFTVGGGTDLGKQFSDVFGPQLGQALSGILDVIFAVRDAITNNLIPAFRILFSSFSSGIDVTGGLGNTFETIAGAIRTVSNDVARAIVVFSQFVEKLRSTAESSALVSTALKVIIAAPFVGLALSLLRVALAFTSIGAQLALVSVAFAGMSDIVRRLSSTFDGSFASIVEGVRRLPPELQILLAVVLSVATAIGVNLAFTAVGAATSQLALMSAPIVRIITNLTNMAGVLTSIVLPAIAGFITRLAYATASVLVFTAALVGQVLVSLSAFAAGLVAATAAMLGISIPAALIVVGFVAIAVAAAAVYLAISTNFLGIRDAIVNSIGPAAAIIRDVFLVVLGGAIVTVIQVIYWINAVVTAFRTIGPSVSAANISVAGIVDALGNFVQGMILAGSGILSTSGVITAAFSAISGVVGPVIQYVIDRLNDFFNTIGAIPLVRDELNRLGVTFLSLRDTGAAALVDVAKVAQEQLAASQKAFDGWKNTVVAASGGAQSAVALFVQNLLAQMGIAGAALDKNSAEWAAWAQNVAIAAGIGGKASPIFGTDVLSGILGAQPPPSDGRPDIGQPDPLRSSSSGKPPKATVDELAASYVKLLAGIEGNVQELAKFLAQLEQANPGRINGLIAALQSMKGIIADIADQYNKVLAVQYAISTVQNDLNEQQAAIDANNLAAQTATFDLNSQLLALDQQRLAIKQQLLPIEREIAAVDAQIVALQAPNLEQERQILLLQQEQLPIKQAIAAVDRQIQQAQRVNYDDAIAAAKLAQQELPIKQQLAALATQINRVEDKRLTLLTRQQEILATQNVDNLNKQLDKTNNDLNKAWQTLNVPQILALEAQKNSLEDSVASAQENLDTIQDTQKTTRENDELITIQLQLQQVALEEMLQPLEDQATALQNIKDTYDANQAIIILGLEQQKQTLEDTLIPLDDQLIAINNLKDAQAIQTALDINNLESQKASLEALAAPMRAQLQAIDDQSAAIQAQIDIINNQFALQNQQFEIKKLQDQTELAALQTIKAEEDARYAALIADYVNAAVQSGAFTASEALETIHRLDLWSSSADAVAAIVTQFGSLEAAAAAATEEINKIPTDILVHVRFQVDAPPTPPSFQYGGVVGGPLGSPQLVIAHGGERFLGVGNKSSSTLAMGTKSAAGPAVVNNYTVNATYANKQSTASIGMDLRALIAMSKH